MLLSDARSCETKNIHRRTQIRLSVHLLMLYRGRIAEPLAGDDGDGSDADSTGRGRTERKKTATTANTMSGMVQVGLRPSQSALLTVVDCGRCCMRQLCLEMMRKCRSAATTKLGALPRQSCLVPQKLERKIVMRAAMMAEATCLVECAIVRSTREIASHGDV